MQQNQTIDIGALVEPDRVHQDCYTDQEIFNLELENIFYKSWIYIGHESQVISNVGIEEKDKSSGDLVNAEGPFESVLQSWL